MAHYEALQWAHYEVLQWHKVRAHYEVLQWSNTVGLTVLSLFSFRWKVEVVKVAISDQ